MSKTTPKDLQAFLTALSEDASSTPVMAGALKELQDEIAKDAAEKAKDQLRQIHARIQNRVDSLRAHRRQEAALKRSIDALTNLAREVIEGNLETDKSFLAQLNAVEMRCGT